MENQLIHQGNSLIVKQPLIHYDDLNIAREELGKIKAKTLIVQGDRDPFYPVEISLEMYHQIPQSSLWIIPNGGHGPLTDDWLAVFKNLLHDYLK